MKKVLTAIALTCFLVTTILATTAVIDPAPNPAANPLRDVGTSKTDFYNLCQYKDDGSLARVTTQLTLPAAN